VMIESIVTAAAVAAEGFNPFSGVSPSFGPFTGLLQSKVGIFLGVAWAIAFVYAAYHLLEGVARAARAQRGGYHGGLDDAKRDIGFAALASVGLAALPVIYAVLIS
jgi:hypothetical protein